MDEIHDGQIVGDINATVSGCRVEAGIVRNSIYFDGVSAWADLGNQRLIVDEVGIYCGRH